MRLHNRIYALTLPRPPTGLPPGLPTWYRRHLWHRLGSGADRHRRGGRRQGSRRLPEDYYVSGDEPRATYPLAGINRYVYGST
jgi:hypothetical protein